eukprot:s3524_g9.t1
MVCSKTGALMGVGVHGVAIIRALCGDEPVVVSATVSEDPNVDSAMSCNLRFQSGAAAHIGCSILPQMAKSPTKFTISGTDGIIRAGVQEWFTGQGQSSNEIALEQFAESGESYVERVDNVVSRDTFYYQLMGFADEIAHQKSGQNRVLGTSPSLCELFYMAWGLLKSLKQYTHEVVTVWYRPPEILLGSEKYSLPVDLWSIGCVIAEMATGSALFPGDSEISTIFKIFQRLGTPTEQMWPEITKLPYFKPTFPQWPAHSWAQIRNTLQQVGSDGADLLDKLTYYDPRRRISAFRALQHPYFRDVDPRDYDA